jgi:16S rRNA processing protein RimM
MDPIEVGYVARPHGVRGELRVQLHDPSSSVLGGVDTVWIGGAPRRIVSARPTTGAVLLTLEGVDGRDAADALKGQTVSVPRSAVALAEGEFLLADLPGCAVADEQGNALGRVVEVIPGAQPILVIQDERHERLLPAIPEFIRAFDGAARRLVVAVPEDLPVEPLRR